MSGEPRLLVAETPAAFDRMAADVVAEAARAAERPFSLALSGGSTPRGLYRLLAGGYKAGEIDWPNTLVFFADERCVPPDSPDSNYGMVRETLLDHVSVPEENIHRMPGELCNAPSAAREYEQRLAAACHINADGLPALDLVILGIGDDGHTASLFPGTSALDATSRWVVANWVPQLDTTRLTLTYPLLAAARRLLLLVAGARKAGVVARVLDGAPKLPASKAVRLGADVTLLLDTKAAAGLA